MKNILGEALELDLGEHDVLTLQREIPAADVWFVANPAIYFGDCTVFRVGGKVGILDVGADKTGETVIDFLTAQEIDHVDYLIFSHYHGDHIGGNDGGVYALGLSALLGSSISFDGCVAYLPHGEIVWDGHTFKGDYAAVQAAVKEILTDAGITIVEPTEGQTVSIGSGAKLVFRNLSAEKFAAYYNDYEWGELNYITAEHNEDFLNVLSYNNFSMITELHHAGHVFLFPGDAERPAQEQNAADISVPDVYRAEHHALNIRTDEAWLRKIHPKVTVIGELWEKSNAYARTRLCPPTVEQTYAGGTVYDTNFGGTIHVRSTAAGLEHESETGETHVIKRPLYNQAIPQGANIDDYIQPCRYYSANGTMTATLVQTSIPVEVRSYGFDFMVYQTRGDSKGRMMQVIRPIEAPSGTSPCVYFRVLLENNGEPYWDEWVKYAPSGYSEFTDLTTFSSPTSGDIWTDRVDFVSGGTKVVGQTAYVYLVFKTKTSYQFPAGRSAVVWIPKPARETPLSVTVNGASGFSPKVIGANVAVDGTHGTLQITCTDTLPSTGTANIIISGSYPLYQEEASD